MESSSPSQTDADMEFARGSPKRRRLQSPTPPPLSIPLQEWTAEQVEKAVLQKDIPNEVAQMFLSMPSYCKNDMYRLRTKGEVFQLLFN